MLQLPQLISKLSQSPEVVDILVWRLKRTLIHKMTNATDFICCWAIPAPGFELYRGKWVLRSWGCKCVCVCGGGVLKLGRKTTIGKANKHCLCLTNLSNAVELCWILSQFLYILCATGKHLDLESVVNIDVWSELEMIVCQFCNSRFHSQKSFILHSKKHEHEKQFILKCDFCPRQYNSVRQFQRHCHWHELKRKRDQSASNEAESSPSPDAWQIARGAPRGGGSYDEQNLRQYNTIHPLAWWRAGGENKRRRARPLPAHVACHSSRGRHARNQAAPRGARAWRRSHRARSASPAVVLHIPVLF